MLLGAAAVGAEALLGGCRSATHARSAATPSPTPSTTPSPTGSPDLAALARHLTGTLIRPGDPGYDTARVLYDPRFDGVRPAAIAKVAGADDVAACLSYAAGTGTPFAVRAGGHSYGGYSTTTGLVIDLTGLAAVNSNRDGTATIGPGAVLGDVYATLAAAGRAMPAGSCATVGFGGLATAGGLGIAMRAWGLTVDVIEAIDVVTADGTVHHCDSAIEPDLFFAMRGAGASIGIATGFTARTMPAPSVSLATVHWQYARAASVIAGWQSSGPSLTSTVWSTCHLTIDHTDAAPPAVLVHFVSLEGLAALDAAIDTVERAVGVTASGRSVETRSWAEASLLEAGCGGKTVSQCHLPTQTPDGSLTRQRMTACSGVVATTMPADAIAAFVAAIPSRDSGRAGILLDALGGAVNAAAVDATAFPHRRAAYVVQAVAGWDTTDSAAATDAAQWVGGVRTTLEPVSTGAYSGYADPGLADYASAYWGANLPRLRSIKQRYDPGGLFRAGQPVP